jgi:hypothetical protein
MRFVALTTSAIGIVVFGVLSFYSVVFVALFALSAALTAIGIWDLLQSPHSIRRNYPILAHIRFMLEKVRPEIRQYFLESDTDGLPFNRSKRAIAYQRAKGALERGQELRRGLYISRTSPAAIRHRSATLFATMGARGCEELRTADSASSLPSASAIRGLYQAAEWLTL